MRLLLIILFLANVSGLNVSKGRTEITEEDGSPSVFPYKIKFSNDTVTDN